MKSTGYFLPQSAVSHRPDLSSQTNFSGCNIIKCLGTLRVKGSIISKDSNITDNINKVKNVLWEKCRTKNGALTNSSFNGYPWKDFQFRTMWTCLLLRKNKVRPNTWLEIPQDLSLWRWPACQTLLSLEYI